MSRIPEKIMEQRETALQEILEEYPQGLSISEILDILKNKKINLPKNGYQAIHLILKNAEKDNVAVKENGKWRLLIEDE